MFETSLLMNHYQDCLRARLALWFEEPPGVVLQGSQLEISSQPPLTLEFVPARCRWLLARGGEQVASGSFDRTSKTARQILSGHL